MIDRYCLGTLIIRDLKELSLSLKTDHTYEVFKEVKSLENIFKTYNILTVNDITNELNSFINNIKLKKVPNHFIRDVKLKLLLLN